MTATEPLDPWARADPDLFAGRPAEPDVADLTSTVITTPQGWAFEREPTHRYPRIGRHRAGPIWTILRMTHGRLRRSRWGTP